MKGSRGAGRILQNEQQQQGAEEGGGSKHSAWQGTHLLSCPLSFAGASQCHCSRRRPELRLRQQQCGAAPGLGGRGVRQAGRRQSPRRQQQQVQHFLWLSLVPRLTKVSFQGVGPFVALPPSTPFLGSAVSSGHYTFHSKQTVRVIGRSVKLTQAFQPLASFLPLCPAVCDAVR